MVIGKPWNADWRRAYSVQMGDQKVRDCQAWELYHPLQRDHTQDSVSEGNADTEGVPEGGGCLCEEGQQEMVEGSLRRLENICLNSGAQS